MSDELITPPDPNFDHVIDQLTGLSRVHNLVFRIDVGEMLIRTFYGGDFAAYHSTAHNKSASFRRFLAERKPKLKELELGEQVLRRCIRVYEVATVIPSDILQKLLFSHVVQLMRLADPAAQRLLAQAAIDNGWGKKDLSSAVDSVNQGKWPDANPAEPGLQPRGNTEAEAAEAPEPKKAKGKPKRTGDTVEGLERTVKEIKGLTSHWAKVGAPKLTDKQRIRVAAVAAELREKAAELEAALLPPEV